MDEFPDLLPLNTPTAQRPLLGLTVLVVEDSRFTCEALRLLCLKSGARIRRADTLSAARRHLRLYRPSVIIIDLGLPDGSGLELIRDLKRSEHGIAAILATSGDDTLAHAARAAGAHGFLSKPILSIAAFQKAILSHLPKDHFRAATSAVDTAEVEPDALAYQDDLLHAAASLSEAKDARTLAYLGRFLSGVARSAGDGVLEDAAQRILDMPPESRESTGSLARLSGLLQARIKSQGVV